MVERLARGCPESVNVDVHIHNRVLPILSQGFKVPVIWEDMKVRSVLHFWCFILSKSNMSEIQVMFMLQR